MEVTEAILTRRSVREFKSIPVPYEIIVNILEIATRSPSSSNSQPWEIFVATGKVLERIRQIYIERAEKGIPGNLDEPRQPQSQWPAGMQERAQRMRTDINSLLKIDSPDSPAARAYAAMGIRLFGAPVVVYLCLNRSVSSGMVYELGLLSQNILLLAQSYGLGSLISPRFAFHTDVLRKELEISDELKIIQAIGLGYPDMESVINTCHSPRRPIQEVARFKSF